MLDHRFSAFFWFFLYSVCLSNDESHKSMELIMCIKFCFFFSLLQMNPKLMGCFPLEIYSTQMDALVSVYITCAISRCSLREKSHICVCASVPSSMLMSTWNVHCIGNGKRKITSTHVGTRALSNKNVFLEFIWIKILSSDKKFWIAIANFPPWFDSISVCSLVFI